MNIYIYTAIFGLYILGAAYFEGKLKEWIELSIRVDSGFREQYGYEYGKISGVITSFLWGPIVILTILYTVGKGIMRGIMRGIKGVIVNWIKK